MQKKDKKWSERAREGVVKNLRAAAKKRALAREVMPDYLADDPRAVREMFRAKRRDANWNVRKKRR
jgi:hypothetical protein